MSDANNRSDSYCENCENRSIERVEFNALDDRREYQSELSLNLWFVRFCFRAKKRVVKRTKTPVDCKRSGNSWIFMIIKKACAWAASSALWDTIKELFKQI